MALITTKDIKRETARFYGIPVSVLDEPGTDRSHALPRQVAMYLSRKMLGMTLMQIGKRFKRDHSNVHYAVRVTKQRPWAVREAGIIERTLRA